MIEPPIPALIGPGEIEALLIAIQERHAHLSADFNRYVVSESTMALCARIQRHVNACWMRNGEGLLTPRRGNHQ